jgi:hypothetical protein
VDLCLARLLDANAELAAWPDQVAVGVLIMKPSALGSTFARSLPWRQNPPLLPRSSNSAGPSSTTAARCKTPPAQSGFQLEPAARQCRADHRRQRGRSSRHRPPVNTATPGCRRDRTRCALGDGWARARTPKSCRGRTPGGSSPQSGPDRSTVERGSPTAALVSPSAQAAVVRVPAVSPRGNRGSARVTHRSRYSA